MLGVLVLCSASEHVFCCTLLTLLCAYMNEWHALCEASEEPCSGVPWWPHTAYGRNLSGVCTDLRMPRGTQCLLRGPTRNGKIMWTELSFLGQTFWSLWPFHKPLGIRSTNLICQIIDFQGTCDLCCYCVLYLGLKYGLVVRKCLASLGIESLEARWSSSSKLFKVKVTQIGTAVGFFLWQC